QRSGARTATTTDRQGRYSFSNLTPDTYVVEVQAKGFQIAASQAIAVAGSQTAAQDFMLTLAGAAESVTVTATGEVDRGYRVAAAVGDGGSAGGAAPPGGGGRAGGAGRVGSGAKLLPGEARTVAGGGTPPRGRVGFAGDVRPSAPTTVEGLFGYYNVDQRGF